MSAVEALLAHPPEPTNRDGQAALLRAACEEGLAVAIMCPTGRVVADARPGVHDRDRIPACDRLTRNGKVPPELATTDADTAVTWLLEYVEENRINDPGIAVEVGADAATALLPGLGLLEGPAKGWVTAWVSPADAARAAQERERIERERQRQAAERREREKIDLKPGVNDPWKRSIRVHPDELGDFTIGGAHGVTEGFYVVKRSKSGMRSYFRVTAALYGSGKLYALRLDPDRYSGKVRKLDKAQSKYPVDECWDYSQSQSHDAWLRLIARYGKRMGAEAFEEFGRLYATCIRCRATLSNPMSTARSYGPVCAVHLEQEHPLSPSDVVRWESNG